MRKTHVIALAGLPMDAIGKASLAFARAFVLALALCAFLLSLGPRILDGKCCRLRTLGDYGLRGVCIQLPLLCICLPGVLELGLRLLTTSADVVLRLLALYPPLLG